MRKLMILFCLVLISGCATGKIDFDDVSSQEAYKNWIGKEIKIKKDVLIIRDSSYGTNNLMVPLAQFYPTIEEYRQTGKSKKRWIDNEEVIGIAEVGRIFKIESVGFYVFNSMIGKRGLVLVKDENNGKTYYIHESDLFSFKNNSIRFSETYIQPLPAPLPAPDEKK